MSWWALIEPVLPAGGHQGRSWDDHRLTLEGIIWRYRTASPWRDVPEDFGAWQSIWERHRRWSDDGTYVRMFAAVHAAAPEHEEELANLLSVDSTVVRAHQHSAGAAWSARGGPCRMTRTWPTSPRTTRWVVPAAGCRQRSTR